MSVGDYHVHTNFSIDSFESMERQCQAAIDAGISEIAITEHVDHDMCDADSRAHYDRDAYLEEVQRCRDQFAGRLTILSAAEVDYNRSIDGEVADFLARHEYDFVMGSVHNLDHVYVGNGSIESFGGARAMYDWYLDEVESMVTTGFPDVVGHLDLPRRYHGISMDEVDPEHFEDRLRRIFRLAVERGVGFELNTSGLRRGVGTSHPSPKVIRWYVEEGGRTLTVGSDSHQAADTGHSISAIHEQLHDLGIDWRTSFVGGAPHEVQMPAPATAKSSDGGR